MQTLPLIGSLVVNFCAQVLIACEQGHIDFGNAHTGCEALLRGDSHIKMTDPLIGKFQKTPLKSTRILFVGVALIHFHPLEIHCKHYMHFSRATSTSNCYH